MTDDLTRAEALREAVARADDPDLFAAAESLIAFCKQENDGPELTFQFFMANFGRDFEALYERVDRILTLLSPPPGWWLAPDEATEEMVAAAESALSNWRKTLDRDEALMRSYRPHEKRMFIASATPAEKHRIRYTAMRLAAPPIGREG